MRRNPKITERNQEVLAIARRLYDDGSLAPSHAAIAREMGITGETVRKHRCKLLRMQRMGLIPADQPGLDW